MAKWDKEAGLLPTACVATQVTVGNPEVRSSYPPSAMEDYLFQEQMIQAQGNVLFLFHPEKEMKQHIST